MTMARLGNVSLKEKMAEEPPSLEALDEGEVAQKEQNNQMR